MKRKHLGLIVSAVVVIVAAAAFFFLRSRSSYLDVIPLRSTALLRINADKNADAARPLRQLLQTADLDDSGIDTAAPLYLFTSPDGNIGFCAKVKSKGEVEKLFCKQGEQGRATRLPERKGYSFAAFGQWLAGCSDEALLMMGPVNPADMPALQSRMARYLSAKSDRGIRQSPLYQRLDSMNAAPMTLVARASALPEKLVAPLTLGLPRGGNPADVIFAANISRGEYNEIFVSGETFSDKPQVEDSLQEARKTYGKVSDIYVSHLQPSAPFAFFANVKGAEFLRQLRANPTIQGLLTGANVAIDMDNIIRSFNGDIAIYGRSLTAARMNLAITAQVSAAPWLKDVDYWKQSVPKGASITDNGTNSWIYSDEQTKIQFGLSHGEFRLESFPIVKKDFKSSPILVKAAVGGRIALVLQPDGKQAEMKALQEFLQPLFGEVGNIVIRIM